ncbi:asparagine synthase [Streptomyces pharetrae CZA14]|uniref:asparagine synthase (glutamine-hydrolyzing) n=1 Tax=Streptomyces pharetrae CZA14 TaxID=1144883 RepID=A0ABX3YMV1_9ACTN|nr:asparagine synthase [Streptomyces pharetrae CZA14]
MSDMHESAEPGRGDAHFAVFPDCEEAAAAARFFRQPATRVLTHASGRPWLIGHWSDTEIMTARAPGTALAAIGWCGADPQHLQRRAARMRDLTEVDALARFLPGSFHLVATHDGQLRVQGTASGLRLVFHARIGGVHVAATSADLLAAALGSRPDTGRLAVRLLWPVPHPLYETSVWEGVDAVSPEDALIVSADGQRVRRSRWWRLPEPTLTLARGAPAVREALAEAVDVRTRPAGVVSCDLSGGLDSTSVCFLAARSSASVVAATWPGRDPADADLAWARQAADHMPKVDHVVWDADASALVYSDLLGIDDLLDEPTIGVMDRSRVLQQLPWLAARGSRVHLTGIGGDHVAWCSEAYYHRLLRTRPLFALHQLRGFRALWNWPLGETARALADARSYPHWLADSARRLRAPMPESSVTGSLSWGMPPRLFPWMTAETERLARGALLASAARAEPLHRDRGLHTDLELIRTCTRIIRQWERMATRAGLPMASPYLDDRVIEACLAVRPDERVTPWQYKPLLTEAMRGVVPDECLRRTNKAEASMDASDGLRRHRGDLMTLWTDSRLERLGLVDGGELRRLAQRPSAPGLRDAILYSTIACEVWLRARDRAPRPGSAVG